MAKSTPKNDLEKLITESEDQRRRMQETWEKIEKPFAQIQKESGQEKLSLLKDLAAEIATAENVLQQTPPEPPAPPARLKSPPPEN